MGPLSILISVFAVAVVAIKITSKTFQLQLAGRIAMSAMLLFTATGHFLFAEGMAHMIPDFIPFRNAWVYLTGFLEIAAAIGLQIPRLRSTTGWLLIVFFVLIFPANIHAAVESINFQTGEHDGPGLAYLWFRVPLQILFIVWTYLSAIASLKKVKYA